MTDVPRRAALKLMAAAAVSGCSKNEPVERISAPAVGADALVSVEPSSGPPWKTRDPFLFCVHHDDHYPAGNPSLGPRAPLTGRAIGADFAGKDGWRMYHGAVVPGFPQHPHRGFETVTVVRRGLLDHADSLGAAARYGKGDVQWLTAGRGILHAEMFPLLDPNDDNPLELFQIWLNLPRADKMVEPHFSMLWSPRIPRHEVRDEAGRRTTLTIEAGAFGDLAPPPPPPSSWAARPESDVAIWTLEMDAGARFTLPKARPGTIRTLYFFRGTSIEIGGRSIAARHQVELRGDREVSLQNGGIAGELLLLQGRPIGEPIARHGPFVMNTAAEIERAYADYRRTQFGGWPWDRSDPVHGPAPERFARHADGRVERPA